MLTRSVADAETPSCYLCGRFISQIECVSHIRLTCFLCSRLCSRGKTIRKSLFDGIDAVGLEHRACLSDSCADYNAARHVSNMLATLWAAFTKSGILYRQPTAPPCPVYLLPLSKHPRQNSERESLSGESTAGVFSAPRLDIERTIRVGTSRVQ